MSSTIGPETAVLTLARYRCILHHKEYLLKLSKGSHYSTLAESISCVASILISKVCPPPPRQYHPVPSILPLHFRYHPMDKAKEQESSLTHCHHQQFRRQSLVASWWKMFHTSILPFLERFFHGVLLKVVCYSLCWCCKDGECSLRSMYTLFHYCFILIKSSRARLVNWRISLFFLMCAILVVIPLAFSLLLSLAKTSGCTQRSSFARVHRLHSRPNSSRLKLQELFYLLPNNYSSSYSVLLSLRPLVHPYPTITWHVG